MTSRHLRALPNPVAEDLAAQDAALDVTCPLCGAQPDTYCVNPFTGRYLHGRVSHWQRIREATRGVVEAAYAETTAQAELIDLYDHLTDPIKED